MDLDWARREGGSILSRKRSLLLCVTPERIQQASKTASASKSASWQTAPSYAGGSTGASGGRDATALLRESLAALGRRARPPALVNTVLAARGG